MASVNVKEIEKGTWRLRWREYPVVDGVRKELGRSYTVGDKRTAEDLAVEIRRAVETQGTWKPPAEVIRTPCNLEAKSVDWLSAKRGRGLAASTESTATSAIVAFFKAVRAVRNIKPDAAIPGTVLTRKLFTDILNHQRAAEMSEQRRYDIARYAADFWAWLSDQDEADRVGMELAPRDRKSLLPRKAGRGDPPPAPTIAEMDAIVCETDRHRTPQLRELFPVLRFTGLRVGQGLALRVKDVDLDRPRLFIESGKGAEERRGRWVPMSPYLTAHLRPLVAGREGEEHIFKSGDRKERTVASSTMKAILQPCQDRGELREDVWRARTRDNSRTTHLFRAGLQAFWENPPAGQARVEAKAIDALVGHKRAGKSVRDLHYSPALWEEMLRAVSMLPAINWIGPARVVPKRRGRKRSPPKAKTATSKGGAV